MKNFFNKVKTWFKNHKPTKRRLIQVYAALLYNANIKGFVSGKIYTGDTKKVCVPGLNCYSCPGAVGACPLGALQDSLANSKTSAPAYIFGILILFGLLLGRVICGFLCPFGLIQELLYKIRTPKLRKNRFTRIASYFKYILLILVIAIPLIYSGIPIFCKYFCPAGTLEGALSLLANIKNSSFYQMLGYLFSWKFCVLVVVIVASVFIYRFLCRFFCPLGAIYSLFCKISLLGVKLDKDKCINCGLCIEGCKMDIKHVGDHECIQCGECISICPDQAISWKGSQIFVRNTTPIGQPVAPEGEKIDLLSLSKSKADGVVGTTEQVETVVEECVQPAQKQGKLNAVKSAFKKPKFVAEFVAWVLAIVVLITALVCYNLPEKQKDVLPQATLSTYFGEEYSTAKTEVQVLYFWRTDMQESLAGVQTLEEVANTTKVKASFVAVHTIYKDDRNVGQFIKDSAWEEYNITFAQDDKQSNLYSYFGGDISVPKPITAVISRQGDIISVTVGEIDSEKLNADIVKAQYTGVYAVGDYCPQFTLNAYTTAGNANATFAVENCLGKVTVLNFWYTNCDPCKAELPEFNSVLEDLGDQINMVAIHSYSAIPREGVQKWLNTEKDKNGKPWKDYKITFAQDDEAIKLYNLLGGRSAYPMTVILNAQGKITKVIQGSCSEKDLRTAITEAKNAD